MQRLLFHVIKHILTPEQNRDENEWKSVFMKTMRHQLSTADSGVYDPVSRFAHRRMAQISKNGGSKFVLESNFEEMYSLLADELKQLYVAITRSRSRIIIFDQDREKREPFYLLCQLTGATSPALLESYNYDAESNRPTRRNMKQMSIEQIQIERAKWKKKGELLLERHFYERAALCFKNAHALTRCREATAWKLLDNAMQAITPSEKSKAFYEAGLRFLMTEQYRKAQKSFRQAGYQDIANHPGLVRSIGSN